MATFVMVAAGTPAIAATFDTSSTTGVHVLSIPGGDGLAANAINNSNEIGMNQSLYSFTAGGYLWPGAGSAENLYPDFPVGSYRIRINDINNAGVAVGGYTTSAGVPRAFTWSESTGFADIGAPAEWTGGTVLEATGIDDQGWIVVQARAVPGSCYVDENTCGFLATPNGGGYDFTIFNPGSEDPPITAATSLFAEDIEFVDIGNGPEHIAAGINLAWGSNSGWIPLAKPTGAFSVDVSDINASGAMAGWANYGSTYEAVYWSSPYATPEVIGTLGSDTFSSAHGISDDGKVVGWSGNNTQDGNTAFVWEPGGTIEDLGSVAGYAGAQALAVNNQGLVVGQVTDSTAGTQAVIWDLDGDFTIGPDVLSADLTVTIERDLPPIVFDNDPVYFDEENFFKATVTNAGPDAANDVQVMIEGGFFQWNLPDQPDCVISDNTGTGVHQLLCDVGTVAAGASAEISIRAVPTDPNLATNWILDATVLSSSGDPDIFNNTGSVEVFPEVRTADLGVTIEADEGDGVDDGTVDLGTTVEYTVEATNYGPHDVPDTLVEVTFSNNALPVTLPSNCVFVPAGDIFNPAKVYCGLGFLTEPGSNPYTPFSTSASFTMQLDGAGTTSALATVSSGLATDTVAANNVDLSSIFVVGPAADLSAGLGGGGPVFTGATSTHVANVENLGPEPATDVVLKVEFFTSPTAYDLTGFLGTDLPAECVYDDVATPPAITCDVGDLAAPDGAIFGPDYYSFRFETTWSLEGSWEIEASVTSGPPIDPVNVNNSELVTVVVSDAEADMEAGASISVADDWDLDGDVFLGDDVTYQIRATNNGPEDAPGATTLTTVDAVEGVDFEFGPFSSVCQRASFDLNGLPTVQCDHGTVEYDPPFFNNQVRTFDVRWLVEGTFDIEVLTFADPVDTFPTNNFATLSTPVVDPAGDTDGDGIQNSVDGYLPTGELFLYQDESPSVRFSDQVRPGPASLGTTTGSLAAAGTIPVIVSDAVDLADGVTTYVPVDAIAITEICGFSVWLMPYSESTHTCGSITTEATSGAVAIFTSDGARVDVPEGSKVTVVDDDSGVSIDVLVGAVTVTVGDLVIDLTEDDDPLLNPGDLVGDTDSDGDGLTDAEEAITGTDPDVADTDGDGLVDGIDASWLYAYVDDLPRSAFRSRWTEFLTKAAIAGSEFAVHFGNRRSAMSLIGTLDARSNGCGVSADRNDWITDCDAQAEFRVLLDLYRMGVETMALPNPRWR